MRPIKIDGLIYKIGKFGLPFFWNCGEWVRSNKSKSQIITAIEDREKLE